MSVCVLSVYVKGFRRALPCCFVWTRREVELLRPSSPKKIKEAKIEASLISFSLRLDRTATPQAQPRFADRRPDRTCVGTAGKSRPGQKPEARHVR